MDPALFALFAVIAIGAVAYSLVRRARRQESAQSIASTLGLRFQVGDPLDLTRLPHRLFRRGDTRRVDLTVHGDFRGAMVALCDYTYTDITRDAKGHPHHSDHRMSMAVLTLNSPLPWIEISPESLGRKILNAVGVGSEVHFESDEFNRMFSVLSQDRDFAFTLIDPAMMEWLQSHAASAFIEIAGEHLIVAVRQVAWDQMSTLAGLAMDFHHRFPRILWESYGPST